MIEKAEVKDIPQLVEMRLAYLDEDTGPDEGQKQVIRESLPDYFERNLNRTIFCYVCREQGTIVSCAFLLLVEKPMSPSFMNGKTGTVLNVYTKPEYRKRGYAGRIMDRLVEEAGNMGLCRIDLLATEAGAPLYRAKGFKEDTGHYVPMKYIVNGGLHGV
ncbi:MAG: GNAT family N-acetyltransferase [Solobacterium sp.]|nr:GNAT family N-acetyltransferase [Solobacterium sp.]